MKKCIITIYYIIDNFCKEYKKWEQNKLLPTTGQRDRAGQLSLSELLAVVLYFIYHHVVILKIIIYISYHINVEVISS